MLSRGRVRGLDAEPDGRLLALARDGNERAFEALVERYRQSLLAHARCLLPAARAEDAVQQGLLQAWLALRRGTDVRDVRPWLYRVVHNSATRMRRVLGEDHAPLTDTIPAAGTPYSDLERQIAARDALAEVAALPGLQREVLLETALGGRTHDQVAKTLGLSDGAVRGLLYRARARLRAAATVLIPSPLITCALRLAGKRLSSTEPLSGADPTTGAGIAAVLAKGGAVAVTVGVLAAGVPALHSHPRPHDTSAAHNHADRHTIGARTARSRVDVDHAHGSRKGSTPAVAKPTATSRASYAPIHLTTRATTRSPEQMRPHRLQPVVAAPGFGSSGTRAGGGLTSVSRSGSSSGSGSTPASSTGPTTGSDATTSAGTGGETGQDKADPESGGSDSSATTPAPPPDASTASTGEGDTSPQSSGSDSSKSAVVAGDQSSSSESHSAANGASSGVGDGGTASELAAPPVPPNTPGSD